MKFSRAYIINVFTTGCIVLMLFSITLFWPVWLCDTYINGNIASDGRILKARPSGLVPSEIEDDPNVVQHSAVHATYDAMGPLFEGLGIAAYPEDRMPGCPASDLYLFDKSNEVEPDLVYFDSAIGQIVSTRYHVKRSPNDRPHAVRLILYAGPEGISEKPDRALGRFYSLIVSCEPVWEDILFAYDKKLRRFFAINFLSKTVVKGPEIPKDEQHSPIQIGRDSLRKNHWIWVQWQPPYVKAQSRQGVQGIEVQENNTRIVPVRSRFTQYIPPHLMFVTDVTGRIDLLNTKTLQFEGVTGYLPAPQTLFSNPSTVRPKDLAAYWIMPMGDLHDKTYEGCFVATLSREAHSAALAFFDENGHSQLYQLSRSKVYYQDDIGNQPRDIPSSQAAFFGRPWAPTVTSIRFLLENLRPPVLSAVSYLTCWRFEATSAFRSIFILPNSFIAMEGRDTNNNTYAKLWGALVLISPSLLLSFLLAWRIGKNALSLGFTQNAAVCWALAAFAFGLVAYITYRLTCSKAVLITCQNCGKTRRPDMDRCHHCKSLWHVPDLIPPSWRVTAD
jgi:hypothetical protein